MSGVAPYLIVFSLSVFLFWLSQKTKGSLCFILVACALLIPSLLAGFRDNSVGTDVMVYGYYSFRGALESGLQEYLISSASYHPLGFNLFSWVMARLGGTLWFYLAAIQLFTSLFVYMGLIHQRGIAVWAGMAAYYLLLFPVSLNAMKQMMAIAVVLWGSSYSSERRLWPFLGSVALATLFHQTALVALAIYPLQRFFESIDSRRAFFGKAQGFAFYTVVVIGMLLVFVVGESLLPLLVRLKDSYASVANAAGTRVNYSGLILLGWSLVCAVKTIRNFSGKEATDRAPAFQALLFVVGCIAIQLNVIAASLLRFSYYGMIFAAPLMGFYLGSKEGHSYRVLGLLSLALFLAYFYVVYAVNGGNAVVPYTSSILGL